MLDLQYRGGVDPHFIIMLIIYLKQISVKIPELFRLLDVSLLSVMLKVDVHA